MSAAEWARIADDARRRGPSMPSANVQPIPEGANLVDRPFPHDVAAERSLLGGFILEPRALRTVELDTADLYRPQHRSILELLREMDVAGEAIDLGTVSARVLRTGDPDHFGGVGYVCDLPEHCSATTNLQHYADRIRVAARRRRLVALAQDVHRRALEGGEPVEDLEAQLRRHSVDSAIVSAGWTDPVPFTKGGGLPRFPTSTLPGRFGEYAEAIAQFTQTPVDLAAMLMLPVFSTACAGKLQVRGRWTEPLVVWSVVALPPASRKSAVHSALYDPVQTFENDAARKAETELKARNAERSILESEISKARKVAIPMADGPAKGDAMGRLRDLEKQLEQTPALFPPARLVTGDATPEVLASLMAAHGRFTVATAEGGELFALALGRYSDGNANLEIYLHAHAGERVVVDRIGRECVRIPRALLSMGLAIQPEVLDGLGRKEIRDRGLLGRFLYSVPASNIGFREVNTAPVPDEIERWYAGAVRSLLEIPGQRDAGGAFLPRTIRLSDDAGRSLMAWAAEVEPMNRPGGPLAEMTDWGGKLVGATLRIAALLHAAENPTVDPAERLLPVSCVDAAVTIARDYLIPHARSAFGLLGASALERRSLRVLRWVAGERMDEFTARDCFRALSSTFGHDMDALWPVLEELERRHYVRRAAPVERPGPGRKPSPVYRVNPRARS